MRRLGEHPLGTFVVVSLLFAGASVLAWLSALVLDWPSALGRYLPLYFWQRPDLIVAITAAIFKIGRASCRERV